jgi:hypothetical protein
MKRLDSPYFLVTAFSLCTALSLDMATTACGSSETSGIGIVPDGGIAGAGGAIFNDGSVVQCDDACSSDRTQVVDCYGVVKEACPADKACYNAKCDKDPCEAAELARGSYGCEFWALKTGLTDGAGGACLAAYVSNTWASPVNIIVDYDGQVLDVATFAHIPKGQGPNITYEPYDAAAGLGVGETAILFLAREALGAGVDCPKPAAITQEVGVSNTGRGKGFHIRTDKPVAAHQILPYGGGPAAFTSATLLLPVSAWDTSYVAVSPYMAGSIDKDAEPFINILAAADATEVTIRPRASIVGGGGVDPVIAGEEKKYLLNKGELLQIEQPEELTGSPIKADKPIGVWGGSSCLYVPLGKNGCDSAQQQIPPVKAFGSEYVGVSYRPRGAGAEAKIPWRIVGVLDGTKLTWEVPEGSPVPAGVPAEIGAGTIVDFEHPGEFIVRSQGSSHPFYLAAYMTGGESYNGEGDPDWVNVIPPAQFLDSYVLVADPTFPETNLVVVRRKSKIMTEGFKDVTLDCLGPISGWKPLGGDPKDPDSHRHEYARVDLTTGTFQGVGGCSSGRRELSSGLPFGVTVWGWGSKAAPGTELVSYGYPGGASVQPINKVSP